MKQLDDANVVLGIKEVPKEVKQQQQRPELSSGC